ncbi:signal peptidase II [Kytococcus aerolatus]|uniref:Lipoprotein signal peptidase n=1 Tax=Kytococcus aerolatus TaxID=592308 RepID=A0A212T4E2_9MICO|nr:signal peptidase II [Kytococcus aerolatus]SNC60879.1 signal peptidase II [Kytococcus aerolatus]
MQAAPGAPLSAQTSDHPTAGAPPARPRRGHLGLVAGIVALWAVLDQVTKEWALRELERGQPVELLGDLLQLRLVFNPGAAFSLGTGITPVITAFAAIVLVALLWFSRQLVSSTWAVALGLVGGGALGNLVDRLLRAPGVARGHVVDFLELPNWPVFNVADIGVTCGAALVVLLALRGIEPTEAPETTDPTDQEARRG